MVCHLTERDGNIAPNIHARVGSQACEECPLSAVSSPIEPGLMAAHIAKPQLNAIVFYKAAWRCFMKVTRSGYLRSNLEMLIHLIFLGTLQHADKLFSYPFL